MQLARSLHVHTLTPIVIVAGDCSCPTRGLVRPTPSNNHSTWRIPERRSDPGTFGSECRCVAENEFRIVSTSHRALVSIARIRQLELAEVTRVKVYVVRTCHHQANYGRVADATQLVIDESA